VIPTLFFAASSLLELIRLRKLLETLKSLPTRTSPLDTLLKLVTSLLPLSKPLNRKFPLSPLIDKIAV